MVRWDCYYYYLVVEVASLPSFHLLAVAPSLLEEVASFDAVVVVDVVVGREEGPLTVEEAYPFHHQVVAVEQTVVVDYYLGAFVGLVRVVVENS